MLQGMRAIVNCKQRPLSNASLEAFVAQPLV